MGEFDLSLIREFRSRPGFYDRNSVLFKDKIYNAREWQSIANKLGYDVSLLKDRMLQLRNRYNLEKRRLEQYHEENPGKRIESPWPLFEELAFLSEHIRARRSYKRLLPGNLNASNKFYANPYFDQNQSEETIDQQTEPADQDPIDSNEIRNSTQNEIIGDAAGFAANGLLAVKLEADDSQELSEENMEQTNGDCADTDNDINTVKHSYKQPTHKAKRLCLPSIQRPRYQHHEQQSPLKQKSQFSRKKNSEVISCAKRPQQPHESFVHTTREQKFGAFGKFMSYALMDLPQQKALLLIEKFTSEVVKVMLQKPMGVLNMPDSENNSTELIQGDESLAFDDIEIMSSSQIDKIALNGAISLNNGMNKSHR